MTYRSGEAHGAISMQKRPICSLSDQAFDAQIGVHDRDDGYSSSTPRPTSGVGT